MQDGQWVWVRTEGGKAEQFFLRVVEGKPSLLTREEVRKEDEALRR